jgi:hypothetical protein
MKKAIRFGAPNLMFFVEDASGGKPLYIDDSNVDIVPRFWVNTTMLIVGTLHRDEGDTHLTVSTSEDDAPAVPPRFECYLDTPSRLLQMSTSEREILTKCQVASHKTRIRVWSNDPKFPDDVFILLG